MGGESRLGQLRTLVARLERLPDSARREWMLEEARARMVDVETGFPSETMRPLHEERRASTGGPGRRDGSHNDTRKQPAPERRVAEERRSPVARTAVEPATRVAADSPSPSALEAGAGHSLPGRDALRETEELLSLEDSSAPASGSQLLPPWRRGLRG